MTTRHLPPISTSLLGASLALALSLVGCLSAKSPHAGRPEKAEKWYQRALGEYRQVSMDAAHDSAHQALELAKEDVDIRTLAARVALARLEYDEVLRLLKGVSGSPAASLRGRAEWYRGDLEHAAEELDQLLSDPEVEDGWAKSISALAHSGAGRKPFDMSVTEGSLAVVEMSRVAPGGAPLYVVPVEIDGEPALALVATGTAELMLDSGSSAKPSWVSLRFGHRLEVRDVPALAQDLSGLSQQLGAPIKALLGANLLRHLNVTLDFRGRQFVARMFSPPAPPIASRLDVAYLRGGGMTITGNLGDRDASSPLLIDTSMGFSMALDDAAWKKLGLDATKLERVAAPGPEIRAGVVPALKLGAFTVPSVPAVAGPNFERLERDLEVDFDGALGAAFLASFRLTLSDGGRVLWLEKSPPVPPAFAVALGADGMPLDGPAYELGLPGQPSPSGVEFPR